ncbi:MAG: hypothetical protein OXC95_08760 [Dehalococcoidia bacterium]|nr:hypothetical protein [Dehalococcoidia bacterium]
MRTLKRLNQWYWEQFTYFTAITSSILTGLVVIAGWAMFFALMEQVDEQQPTPRWDLNPDVIYVAGAIVMIAITMIAIYLCIAMLEAAKYNSRRKRHERQQR